jgi:hypothetical protein
MGKFAWYLNRLRAMSAREVLWRLRQKRLQRQELRRFQTFQSILDPLYPDVEAMVGDAKLDGRPFTDARLFFDKYPAVDGLDESQIARAASTSLMAAEEIELLGPFNYEDFATNWHAGFNTDRTWPLLSSYKLEYKQQDKIGDARINWELNRHRQFTRLAYAYSSACLMQKEAAAKAEGAKPNAPVEVSVGHTALTAKPKAIIKRLAFLVDDWAKNNPFLQGISWTSPMEIALRSISWLTAARILAAGERTPEVNQLINQLLTGAANMTEYLRQHESGFSSANNHLIIEVAAVALAGFIFQRDELVDNSIAILDRELHRQVSLDGVDLESSLHYHGFVFEAYLLIWYEMKAVGRELPPFWRERLGAMARYLCSTHVEGDTYCIFGDDDEARIMDFGIGNTNYFNNLLGFYSRLTNRKFELASPDSVVLTEGGYSFFRRNGAFVGIDHAPLGFGTIAAHGHADALSFQFFLGKHPMLIDSGTYLYHVDLPRRNQLRSSLAHNTVTINGQDQSQMLGPFLWGKKAETRLLDFDANYLLASVKGISGVTHTRRFDFATEYMQITDSFDQDCSWTASFIVAPGLDVEVGDNYIDITNQNADGEDLFMRIVTATGTINTETVEVAPSYGSLTLTTAIRIVGNSRENLVTLQSRKAAGFATK